MSLKDEETICPWCQTEIVWDPEIGPEEECPHCLNELGDYRSIDLKVKQTGQSLAFGDEDEEDDGSDAWEDFEQPAELDSYGERVQRLTDVQEEAPECTSCHEFMLLAGNEVLAQATYIPHVSSVLQEAFLPAPFTLQVYVCPSCFKVEKYLSEPDRIAMVNRLKQE
jgi:hypothetical protein